MMKAIKKRDEVEICGYIMNDVFYNFHEGLSYGLDKEYGEDKWSYRGKYRGHSVYEFNNKLYAVEESSWVNTNNYVIYFKELTEKGYKYFE